MNEEKCGESLRYDIVISLPPSSITSKHTKDFLLNNLFKFVPNMKTTQLIKQFVILALITSSFYSCSDDNLRDNTKEEFKTEAQLRSFEAFTDRSNSTRRLRTMLRDKYALETYTLENVNSSVFEKLGYGYDLIKNADSNSPNMEAQENITSAVLDMVNILQSDDQYVSADLNPLNSLDYTISSFANFEEDVRKKLYSFTDSLGFGVKLGGEGFKWLAQASASFKKGFMKSTNIQDSTTSRSVFAQASLLI